MLAKTENRPIINTHIHVQLMIGLRDGPLDIRGGPRKFPKKRAFSLQNKIMKILFEKKNNEHLYKKNNNLVANNSRLLSSFHQQYLLATATHTNLHSELMSNTYSTVHHFKIQTSKSTSLGGCYQWMSPKHLVLQLHVTHNLTEINHFQ